MLKFISFGSGSSGNCYLLFTETCKIMIDVGVGIRNLKKEFRDKGLDMNDIKYILLTHDHADHIKSVGSMSYGFNIPVYTTAKVHEGVNRNYCVHRKIPLANVKYVEKGQTTHLDEFAITPFNVPHDSRDNVGYKIQCGDIMFCLITDAGYVTEDMSQAVSEANYLVVESNHDKEMLKNGPYSDYLKQRIAGPGGHLNNNECAQLLVNSSTPKLRHVWLCHLSDENNHPELARKTVETELRSVGIVPGVDFELDVLKRNMPSEIFTLD